MIVIGADHAGFLAKEKLKQYLKDNLISVKDLGTESEKSCDYPLIAKKVADEVSKGRSEKGILICGSGVGMCIASNKVKGIRSAVCNDLNIAKLSRSHNNANILCMGARIITVEEMEKITDVFLNTPFDGNRHQLRIDQISEIEKSLLN